MYYNPIECGTRIAHLRTDCGFTQLQAAEKLNVSVQHYRAVEAGRRSASIELLIEIANTFQASLDYIIFGQSIEPRLQDLKLELHNVIFTLKAMEKTL